MKIKDRKTEQEEKEMFEVKISRSNCKTTKQELMLKETSDAIRLGDYIQSLANDGGKAEAIVKPEAYAVLEIHNDKAKQSDYTSLVFIADGQKYCTSSESFITAFESAYADMVKTIEDGEDAAVKVFGKPSKNNNGNLYLSACLC